MKPKKLSHGLFLTLEGPEGSGKSTQIPHIVKWLKSHGYHVRSLREPGGTELGEKVREVLLTSKHDITTHAELFLFLAARAQLVEEVILPVLKRGEVVVCDRYLDSTVVYQGIAGGLGHDFVERLSAWGAHGLRPDISFFLDLPHDQGLKRTGRRDRMELKSLHFHKRVREGYQRLAKRHAKRVVVIDARENIRTVWANIERELERFFK